jgi:hypothetical protein
MSIQKLTYAMGLMALMGWIALGCTEEETPVGDDDDTSSTDDDDDTSLSDDDDDDDTVAGDDDDIVSASEGEIVGNDYHVDLTSATFTEPPGVGGLIGQYLGEVHLAFHVTALDGGSGAAEVYSTLVEPDGDTYTQDLCMATHDLSADAVWAAPYLEMTFNEWVIAIEGNECTVDGMLTSFAFPTGGEVLAAGTLEGELNTLCLDEMIDPGADPGAACDLLASLGIQCIDCADGSGPFCLFIAAEDIGGDIAEVTGADPETGEATEGLQAITDATVTDWVAGGYCP